MTENDLVAALRQIVEAPERGAGARIVLGIGDDAAAWQPSRSHLSVITTDALVDGVHFVRGAMAPRAVGHRAMAANLSDVAAMGARPLLATVALGVPPDLDKAWILDCYRGMAELAARHRTSIVGGDLVRAPAVTLALTVVGEVARPRLKRRSGGRSGDVLAVTGMLGASRAGLELMRRSLPVDERVRSAARSAFETPVPRMREGRWLGASVNVHAMMDCSDGLSTDVARLAAASACGATLDEIPVHPAALAVATAAGHDPLAYALDGGEDFELIVAVAPRAFSYVAQRFHAHFRATLHPVGHLETEPGLRLRERNEVRVLAPAGYDHPRRGFRKQLTAPLTALWDKAATTAL